MEMCVLDLPCFEYLLPDDVDYFQKKLLTVALGLLLAMVCAQPLQKWP